MIDGRWVSSYRTFLMGLGILLVVLFHATSTFGNVFILFKYGFIGVDIFIFISGFGLTRSYESNRIKKFYKHRIIRILPLFVLFALCKSLLYEFFGFSLTIKDYVYNISTLSYYGIGGQFIDWYLCSAFLFYILFPMLYLLVKSFKWKIILISLLLVISLYFIFPDIHWSYKCFISRIPIFLCGICMYLNISILPPPTMDAI